MYWLALLLIFPYLFLLFRIYLKLTDIKTFNITSDPSTFISVIVPCRNEEANLPSLLQDLTQQDYPRQLHEIIIVDDNSTDATAGLSSKFNQSGNIITIRNRGRGKKQAIRTGINASSGSLIVTTDADCHMGKKWLHTIAAYHEVHHSDLIISPVRIESGSGFFRSFQEIEFMALQGVTAGSLLLYRGTICNGANLSFPRGIYYSHSHNLHDEIVSGDDIFLLHSIKKEPSSRISWLESRDAVVTTNASHTIPAFLRQRARWISKTTKYTDNHTILLGVLVFIAVLSQLSLLIAGLFNISLLPVFLTAFLLKSVPDLLIMKNTSNRYGYRLPVVWFLPAQLLYPLYLVVLLVFSFLPVTENINSPSQTGT